MKKIIAPFVALALLALIINSCSKDTAGTGSADKVVGTYSVADTFYHQSTGSCNGAISANTFSLVIQKIDTGMVRILPSNCSDTIIASVTSSWVSAINAGNCYSDFSGGISGGKIFFTYSPRIGVTCDSIGKAVATKK